MDPIDIEDWQSYCRGDRAAIGRIYERNADNLYSFCLYLCGDKQLSEDVLQDSFMKLMKQKENGKISRSVKSWLFVVARNLVYNHKKKLANECEYMEIVDGQEISPEIHLFLKNVLSRLSPQERELILLREYQQFSIGQIAQMLELSDEATRVRLYRIRKKMQALERIKI